MKKTSYLIIALVALLILSTFVACDFGSDERDTSSESSSNSELQEPTDTENFDDTSDTEDPEPITPEFEVDPEIYKYIEFTSNGDGTCTLTSIGDYAAEVLVIPSMSPNNEKVTKIGQSALSKTNFKKVVIPEGIQTILGYAFYECEALEAVYIPKTVKTIYGDTFTGCTNIKEVHITDMTAWMSMELSEVSSNPFRGSNTVLYLNGSPVLDLIVPDDVTHINKHTFSSYKYLQSITTTQNSKLVRICESAFSGCVRLMRVVLPSSLRTIEENAFFGCLRLVEVVNYSPLTIGRSNTNGYVGYYSVKIETDITALSRLVKKGDFVFYNDETEGVCLLIAYLGDETELFLPSDFEGKDYVINEYFYSAAKINKITVGKGVTRIAANAFANKENLKTVVFESESKLKYIDQQAFAESGIESIVIPNQVVIIGVSAFEKCKNLRNVTFEENSSLEVIAANTFYDCRELTEITIPATVMLIGTRAFSACIELNSVIFENPQGWNLLSGGVSFIETLEADVLSNPRNAFGVLLNMGSRYILFRGTVEEYQEFVQKSYE